MKIFFPLIEQMHLDSAHALLSVQNIVTTMELFHAMDIHEKKCINDVQFHFFMKHQSDLGKSEIDVIFKLLDVDQSGEIEFDEFYLIFCIMVACKDQYEKEFIYRHAGSIFQLIDQDSSGHVSSEEFSNMGILFNFDKNSIMSIFNEFDISGDKNLDFSEFRLFTMACIDEQRGIEANKKVTAFRDYNHRLLHNLSPCIKRYIQTRVPPPPYEIEAAVDSTEPPYFLPTKYRKTCLRQTFDFFDAVGYLFLSFFHCIASCFQRCSSRFFKTGFCCCPSELEKNTKLDSSTCCTCGRGRQRRRVYSEPFTEDEETMHQVRFNNRPSQESSTLKFRHRRSNAFVPSKRYQAAPQPTKTNKVKHAHYGRSQKPFTVKRFD